LGGWRVVRKVMRWVVRGVEVEVVVVVVSGDIFVLLLLL
jgi:hypothetical protein